ncbi:MAG TPA: outer membrane protein assembly factor BamA [Terriglobales bacterium]|nr:outer membrane protein assembly factor BamA [Terriglobales bacterium]
MALFFLPGLAAAQELIQEIQIHGNRRIPAETIRARIFSRAGDVYDEAALQRDFNSLWNTNFFEDVRFEREEAPKGWRVHIYIKEKPTIRAIDYKGLSSVSVSDVLNRYKERKVGLTVENQYDPTKIKKAEVVLKELLSEHGHQFATIRSEVRPIPPASVGLTFIIKEGPKVKVGNIRFEGNKHIGSKELRRAMKNLKPIGVPHSIFLEGIIHKTYDATKLNEDAERVRNAYQMRGYFKALVEEPKTKVKDTGGLHIPLILKGGGKAVDITIPIEEGERYRLGGITFKGNKAIKDAALLRSLFPMKDGDIFNTDNIRKGLENLRKGYGELGYINFTSVPDTQIDDDKKLIRLEIDLDEGKPFYIRRIEFVGNQTTRDKVIRRELAVEEGGIFNGRAWEFSILRLNQLGYFEQLKPEEDSERRLNEKEGTVDLTLKVKEKGKNSVGLTGGVSGLSGSFIGLNYETNNFLGLGETLRIEANVGDLERNVLFGFTEPYMFDRPLQFGFTVYARKFNYNQARQTAIAQGLPLNLPSSILDQLQNYNTSSKGVTTSLSYPLKRSLKRLGLTYSLDSTSVTVFSDASRSLFEQLAFRGIAGPAALNGVITSKLVPTYSVSTIDNPQRAHRGRSLFVGGEIAGLGGNVRYIRPIVEFKYFRPMNKDRNTLGVRFQGSFMTGYAGRVAPPFQRFYIGGDTDLRGFDVRAVSPVAFLVDKIDFPLLNPDGTSVPKDPTNLRRGVWTVPIPVNHLVFPGGDTSLISNIEYRIPIVGPVTLAVFTDFGMNFIARPSQLRVNATQLASLNTIPFGCPVLDGSFNCVGNVSLNFEPNLKVVSNTNFVPRMSSGLELQILMPVVNAPFRIYYAYNPFRMNTSTPAPVQFTRDMFPVGGAGDFSYQQALQAFGPIYRLRDPRTTFRFTVSTTF